jgi:triosephosphate isomerase (TIM)
MKKLVIANWKMHFNREEATVLVKRLAKQIKSHAKTDIVLCPPVVDIYPLQKLVQESKFKLGVQNVHYLDMGPVTGEVSAAMLRGLVEYVIVGHSERRQQFSETNEVVARKVAAVVRNEMTPVLCVGETLTERSNGETARVIHDQLAAGLTMLATHEVEKVVVTYEPVWAISGGDGHGQTCSPEQVKTATQVIHKTLKDLYGDATAKAVKILYGGSVNSDNASGYLKLKAISGFLVGGASLQAFEFSAIIKASEAASKPKA